MFYLGTKNVVWSHTNLSAVHKLAPTEPLDSVLQVPAVVNVRRRLPAQLQRARGQVLIGRLSDVICHRNTEIEISKFTR